MKNTFCQFFISPLFTFEAIMLAEYTSPDVGTGRWVFNQDAVDGAGN